MTTKDYELAQCADLLYRSEPWITLNFSLEKCLAAMKGDFKEVYITKTEGKVTGFVVILLYGVLRGYIQMLCVCPEHRNKRIGTALLTYSQSRILKMSPNVFICVSSFNQKAQKLYKNFGFEKIGELKNHIVMGHDEYILRKSFGPTSEFSPI